MYITKFIYYFSKKFTVKLSGSFPRLFGNPRLSVIFVHLNAKPDVTFPAKKIHLVKSARRHIKWFETLRFCISSVMKRGENTCAKRKPKECTAQ